MLETQLGAIELEVTPYKIQNDLTDEQLTTGWQNKGKCFYFNIFYSTSNKNSSNMMNTYLAKQL